MPDLASSSCSDESQHQSRGKKIPGRLRKKDKQQAAAASCAQNEAFSAVQKNPRVGASQSHHRHHHHQAQESELSRSNFTDAIENSGGSCSSGGQCGCDEAQGSVGQATITMTAKPEVPLELKKHLEYVLYSDAMCAICHTCVDILSPEGQEQLANCTSLDLAIPACSCKHLYCYACLREWTTDYRSECPVCKCIVSQLFRWSQTAPGVVKYEPLAIHGVLLHHTVEHVTYLEAGKKLKEQNVENQSSLDGLDHSFFIEMVMQLLSRVERCHSAQTQDRARFSSNFRLNTKQKQASLKLWDQVQAVKNKLLRVEEELRRKQRFEPDFLLTELYTCGDELTIYEQQCCGTKSNVQVLQQRFSAEDAEQFEDDCYDEDFEEYEEEDYFGNKTSFSFRDPGKSWR